MPGTVGGFGGLGVNDPLAGGMRRNVGLVAAGALMPVVILIVLPLGAVVVGVAGIGNGNLGAIAVGEDFLFRLAVIAQNQQLHVRGVGFAAHLTGQHFAGSQRDIGIALLREDGAVYRNVFHRVVQGAVVGARHSKRVLIVV